MRALFLLLRYIVRLQNLSELIVTYIFAIVPRAGFTPKAEELRSRMGFVETPEGVREKSWATLLAFFAKNLN